MAERLPFDAADPSDAMAEMFRRQVMAIALNAYKVTLYRDLNPQQQLECFLAGAMTGVIGVALASIKTEGADEMMEYIASCLPLCREQAEGIRSDDGEPVLNRHDADVGTGKEL